MHEKTIMTHMRILFNMQEKKYIDISFGESERYSKAGFNMLSSMAQQKTYMLDTHSVQINIEGNNRRNYWPYYRAFRASKF